MAELGGTLWPLSAGEDEQSPTSFPSLPAELISQPAANQG